MLPKCFPKEQLVWLWPGADPAKHFHVSYMFDAVKFCPKLTKSNQVTVLFWSLLKARLVSASSLDASKLYAVQAFAG